MQIDSSTNSKDKDLTQSLKIKDEKINCKDGFCTLPIQNGNSSSQKNKVNLFDPI